MSQSSSFGSRLSYILRKADLFPHTQFLRYRGEPEYGTTIGGCMSLLLVIIFILLFASVGLQTLYKEIIFSDVSHVYEKDPRMVTVNLGREDMFMFGLGIVGLNLNDPNVTYFDFELIEEEKVNISMANPPHYKSTEPCTREHWPFQDFFGDVTTDYGLDSWKCPPLNYKMEIGGKIVGGKKKTVTMTVKKCNTSLHDNCVSDAQLAAIQDQLGGSFSFVVGIVNVVINPTKKEYIMPIIEERNYYTFRLDQAINANAYVLENRIESDESLSPFPDFNHSTYYSMPDYFQTYPNGIQNDTYVEVHFQKSTQTRVYTRSFNKIEDLFSHVGGLIGTLVGFIYLMSVYSEKAYEVSMASQIFTDDDGFSICSSGFHPGYLVTMACSMISKMLCCGPTKWSKTEMYARCLQQVEQQLDIAIIMKKLTFFERVLTTLVDQEKLQMFRKQPKITLSEAQNNRKAYQRSQDKQNQELQRESSSEESSKVAVQKSPQVVALPDESERYEEMSEPHTKKDESSESIVGISLESNPVKVSPNEQYQNHPKNKRSQTVPRKNKLRPLYMVERDSENLDDADYSNDRPKGIRDSSHSAEEKAQAEAEKRPRNESIDIQIKSVEDGSGLIFSIDHDE